MKRSSKWLRVVKLAVYAGIGSVISLSCSNNSYEGKIVAVEDANLIAIDPLNPDKPAVFLSKDFVSAGSPSVSHEGRYLFFQGKQNENDPWQIWVMDLQKKSSSQVTHLPENCIHPASLPDGTVVFSRQGKVKDVVVHDLWRCSMDGSGLNRITFNPAANLHPSVLWEGRVLYSSSEEYPVPKKAALMVMRPDGTKSEVYSRGSGELHPAGKATESAKGYVYFISSGGKFSRLEHKRPLHTFENLSEGIAGSFASVIPFEENGCLVSYRSSEGEAYGLYRFNPDTRETPSLLYQGEADVTDPVLIAAMPERPRILPSAVNPELSTGLLMSQDINHSQLPVHPGISGDSLADRIRISSLEKELGVVEVKADGSFYVKMDSDTPFRIESLNKQGETVRGPSDWIYLRPNERRGCVGCHADPELAPKNFQPLAVKEDPVVLSVEKKDTSQ